MKRAKPTSLTEASARLAALDPKAFAFVLARLSENLPNDESWEYASFVGQTRACLEIMRLGARPMRVVPIASLAPDPESDLERAMRRPVHDFPEPAA